MADIALHRNVEEILHGYEGLVSADAPERQRTEDSITGRFSEMLKDYEQVFEPTKKKSVFLNEVFNRIDAFEKYVLSPAQISGFFAETAMYDDSYWSSEIAGRVATKLVMASYNSGFNGFYLDTTMHSNNHVGWIMHYAIAKPERPLEITISGPVDIQCGFHVQHCRIKVESIGSGFGGDAESTVFRTRDRGIIRGMRKSIRKKSNNTICLINPDNTEQVVYPTWKDRVIDVFRRK